MDKGKVYIVIPVFNHAEKLGDVIQSLFNHGYHHVIVVNDGSTDTAFQQLLPSGIHYVEHRVNLGQGAALQTGFDLAIARGADMVVSFDADGQHDASDIEPLLAPVLSGQADVSMGSRFLATGESGAPLPRTVLLKTARIINYLFTGIKLTDAHNGLRAINRRALGKIRITENRMAHATEILFEIRKHGLRFREVPVHIRYTDYSRSNGQSAWNSIRIFFDILFYKLFA